MMIQIVFGTYMELSCKNMDLFSFHFFSKSHSKLFLNVQTFACIYVCVGLELLMPEAIKGSG